MRCDVKRCDATHKSQPTTGRTLSPLRACVRNVCPCTCTVLPCEVYSCDTTNNDDHDHDDGDGAVGPRPRRRALGLASASSREIREEERNDGEYQSRPRGRFMFWDVAQCRRTRCASGMSAWPETGTARCLRYCSVRLVIFAWPRSCDITCVPQLAISLDVKTIR